MDLSKIYLKGSTYDSCGLFPHSDCTKKSLEQFIPKDSKFRNAQTKKMHV